MKKLISHRMKKGMFFEDCVLSLCDNIIGLIVMLPEACKQAQSIMDNERASIGILSMLDTMEIYGNDLAVMFSDVCERDNINLLTIIWAFEIGNQIHDAPDFAKLEVVKKLINDAHNGIRKEKYPFEEARRFIEGKSHIRFPVADFSFLEKGNVFSRMIGDAYAFVFDKDARTISNFTFTNGGKMSIRDAKRAGLIQA